MTEQQTDVPADAENEPCDVEPAIAPDEALAEDEVRPDDAPEKQSSSAREDSSESDADLQNVTPESIVEALLMSTDTPLAGNKIAQLLGVGDGNDVRRHVESLNRRYEAQGASFRIRTIAKGYQVLTQPEFDTWVRKLLKARADSRLSNAALETLAIVAYKQPILRADIESIRGVAVGDMLVRLREMNLVRIAGRAEEIGRPLLYGTTKKFLDVFGLASLNDLPKLEVEGGDRPIPKLVMPEDPDNEPAEERERDDQPDS